jgi:uncharacterized integral membrane protein (TIGR00697 family)
MKLEHPKSQLLFIVLGGIFITNALLAEFIGVKIFSLESTLGIAVFDFSLFGRDHLSFNMTAGVLLWPVVFVLTDIINEYYGMRGVKLLSWMAAALIGYAFIMVWLSMGLSPAEFWIGSRASYGVPDMQAAFTSIYGQGLWIIIGSLIAFLAGQLVDVIVFHRLRRLTGERMIWLRATGSTLVSQFIDSFVVLFVAFYIGAGWDLSLVLAIGVVNYTYKFVVAVLMTPALYGVHFLINRYLGDSLAHRMMSSAESSSKSL